MIFAVRVLVREEAAFARCVLCSRAGLAPIARRLLSFAAISADARDIRRVAPMALVAGTVWYLR
eukprot:2383671-Alexandrium_andersonii.AAC.1